MVGMALQIQVLPWGDTFPLVTVYDRTASLFFTSASSALYTPAKITLNVGGNILTLKNKGRLVVSDNAIAVTKAGS